MEDVFILWVLYKDFKVHYNSNKSKLIKYLFPLEINLTIQTCYTKIVFKKSDLYENIGHNIYDY